MYDVDIIKPWIWNAVSKRSPPLVKCLLFGSVLQKGPMTDVDVILVASEWDVRPIISKLKSDFSRQFRLSLHVQLFHDTQLNLLSLFLNKALFAEEVL